MNMKKKEQRRNAMISHMIRRGIAGAMGLMLLGFSVSGLNTFSIKTCAAGTDGTENEKRELVTELADPELIHPDNAALNGYDIVFVVDNSGSLWNQQEIRDRALHTVADLAVGSDVRIGAVYFGDRVYATCKLTSVKDEASYKDVINQGLTMTEKDESNRNTNIGEGLKAGLTLFEDQDTSRERIIILLSDGINENLAQNPAYKKAADEETTRQVARIREKGYPIYCAFIEKDYADREYLRKLVNYFEDSAELDDRLVTVSDSDIHKLADCMAEIFYKLNGGMKYKKLSLDSNGNYSFFIPDIHITQLQIYLNNSDQITSSLTDSKGKQVEGWSEGDSSFYTVENPDSGEWKLEVSGGKDGITGTIAYYTDVCVKTSLTGKICRGGSGVFTAEFFDGNGTPISLEKGAQVTADLVISDSATGEILQETRDLPMNVKDGKAVSEKVDITAVGNVTAGLHIGYDEYIALNYTVLRNSAVTPVAPIAEDYHGKWFGLIPAVSEEGRMQFTLNLSSCISDPDSDPSDFAVPGTAAFTGDNPMEAEIRDGKLVITTEKGQWKPAAVEGKVTLRDQDGLTAELNIEGCVINRMLIYSAAFLVIVLIGFAVGVFVIGGKKRKQMLESVQNYLNDFTVQLNLARDLKEKFSDLCKENQIDEYTNALDRLQEMIKEEEIPESVQEILELKDAMPPAEMQNILQEMERAAAQITETYDFGVEQRSRFEVFKSLPLSKLYKRQTAIRYAAQNMRRENDDSEKRMEALKDKLEAAKKQKEKVEDSLRFLDVVRSRRFEHNIVLRIDGYKAVSHRDRTSWYCVMDDIPVEDQLPEDTVSVFFGEESRVIFVPYETKDSNTGNLMKGVIAVSDRELETREKAESEDFAVRDKTAVFMPGKKYRMDVPKLGTVYLQLTE
ncbi:MAG: VWA domain-containing protein [Lachnospiraceae bacterium]|nr:VWA domain-containing protein [Lachnospiraceae bacterium]